jgi:hypothetical protein
MSNNSPPTLHSVGEVLDRIEAQQAEAETFKGSAHDLLVATYQGRYRPTPMQLRAATIAIAYESPKLAVIGHVGEDGSFAERLERALARSNVKVIEHREADV